MKRTLINILTIIFSITLSAQITVQRDDYKKSINGVYCLQSLRTFENILSIEPQMFFYNKNNVVFINPDNKPVFLFDKISDKGYFNPISSLTKASIIEIDTVFYNGIYKDTLSSNKITFNVWYAIKINGKKYYTDYQIHDRIIYKTDLKILDQKFMLIAQSSGYDYSYSVGYPSKFFVVILNKNDEAIYISKIFDYKFGDEFWSEDYISIKNESSVFEFTLKGIEKDFSAIWTGRELKTLNK
ncbi:MAG: hypothetical protein WCK02_07420 [Bacteroidota bacterium]